VDDSFVSWPPMFLMTFLPPVRFLSEERRVCCRLVRRCRHDDDDDDKSSIIETYERKEFRFDRGVCVVDWMSTSEEMGARLILCRRVCWFLFVLCPFHYCYSCIAVLYCTVLYRRRAVLWCNFFFGSGFSCLRLVFILHLNWDGKKIPKLLCTSAVLYCTELYRT
jgi:hypothetical protein